MASPFYDTTQMGEGFVWNPVLAVQRRQLGKIVPRSADRGWSVLDLGCGAGTTTRELFDAMDGVDVVGADVAHSAVTRYVEATGRPATRLDATMLPFASASFDLVISDDVVEHLVDTDAYAREIRRVLRPHGSLLLSTPNLAAWFNRLGLLAGLQPAFTEVSFERVFGRPGHEIVGHLRLFTWRSTKQFLTHHGFDVVDVRGARFDAMRGVAGVIDRLFERFPSLAGNTVVVARRGLDPHVELSAS